MGEHTFDILVTEANPGDGDAVIQRLGTSGHRVHRCHPEPASGAAASDPRCVAWHPGGSCPLITADISLVVDARTHGPETPREQGAMCAILANVPLVVCGPTDTTNTLRLRADVICRADRLELACHTATSPVGPAAHRAVTQAVRTALTGLGGPPPVSVHLDLRDNTVVADVSIHAAPCATTYPRVRSAVRTALARFTEAWPYTPVTIHHDSPAERRLDT